MAEELHGVVTLLSCYHRHPLEKWVALVCTNPSDGAVTLHKVPDSIIMRTKRDGAAHVDPQSTSSGGIKVRGASFKV